MNLFEDVIMIETDVLVVGAGPAGSMAAKHAALGGADVILIDKKSEIGTPKRCAEGVYESGLRWLEIEPDPAWIAQRINGGVIVAPNGTRLRGISLRGKYLTSIWQWMLGAPVLK